MNLDNILEFLRDKPRVDPRPFTCEACQDTGWVEVDDGLDADGRRVGQPTSRKCESVVHGQPERVEARVYEVERFT